MRKLINWVLAAAVFALPYQALAYNTTWTQVEFSHVPSKGEAQMHPRHYLVYALNTAYFKELLFSLPADPKNAVEIELPLPDGSFRTFKVWESSMMPKELANKYPNIKTFTAVAADNAAVRAKLDFTETGFHAMIFDGQNTSFIDPYNLLNEGLYMCHYKRDETRALNERMQCMVKTNGENEITREAMLLDQTGLPALAGKTVNGYNLHTYRLALSCSNQYAAKVCFPNTPTKALTFSAMTTTMNRVNGVFEWEMSISMQFVPNEDTLIFIVPAGDPFNADNNIALNLLDDNQTVCDARIGNANYDMGHVFTTGSGGLSDLTIVCAAGDKARSTTGSNSPTTDGFDIDFVAHEMGHEFGANHTFNNNTAGSCWNNGVDYTAYEPGSGSTIMAYAGICGPDDIQPHSDDYFHAASLLEMYVGTIIGTTCGTSVPTGNHPSALAPFNASYTIPYKTPFELMAPGAVDSVFSITTYCWEQWDLGSYGSALNNTYVSGPIFRSFHPDLSTIRVFPRIDSVLKGVLSYVTTENAKGEKVPDTARSLTFKLTLRNIHYAKGIFDIPGDSIRIDAVSTGATANFEGFKVTSPSTAVSWTGGTNQNVTWNVVGSNSGPVNCSDVNVYVSTDGGHTWPYFVGMFTNNGSASITVPNVATTSAARIKVKGNNNVFFNVNGSNFTINFDPALPVATPNNPINQTVSGLAPVQGPEDNFVIYPVPASETVNVETTNNSLYDVSVLNNIGQIAWKGQMINKLEIPVNSWAKGVYYMLLTHHGDGKRIVKPILIK